MGIVTLTTDFGTKDYFVGSLKGSILQQDATLTIVDISHNIRNYDIVQAAFVLKNVYLNFPPDTVHVALVNTHVEKSLRLLCCYVDSQYFIGPDNGLFSLMFGSSDVKYYSVPYISNVPGGLKQSIASTIAAIMSGSDLEEIGSNAGNIVLKIQLQPVVAQHIIRGSVIYIDHYENVILNVTRPVFEKARKERQFELYYKRFDPITELSNHYSDVEIGEMLCLFNDAGYLELAVNMGRASTQLGLKKDDMVQIHFIE